MKTIIFIFLLFFSKFSYSQNEIPAANPNENFPNIIESSLQEYNMLEDLEKLNEKIDEELSKRDPNYKQKVSTTANFLPKANQNDIDLEKNSDLNKLVNLYKNSHKKNENNNNNTSSTTAENTNTNAAPKITVMQNDLIKKPAESSFSLFPNLNKNSKKQNLETTLEKQKNLDFLTRFKSQLSKPVCLRKEGIIKVREADQQSKEVPLTFAILTKDRLTYFVDPKDESTIQGSIELKTILTPIQQIKDYTSCFEIRTMHFVHDCAICVENDKVSREWISAITTNIVNCN